GARDAPLAAARTAALWRVGADAAAGREAALAPRLDGARRRRTRQAAARAALRDALTTLQAARAELSAGGPGASPLPRIVTAEAALAEFVDAAGGAPPGRLPQPRPPAPGTLASPLDGGRPASRFGAPDTLGQPTPGLRLAAPAPATARAPTTASVRFAGPLAGFGTVAILELGPGRLLTLAGLDALAVEAGETVREGAVIGHIGVTVSGAAEFPVEAPRPEGAGSVTILYAETREGGRPVDPRGWFQFQGKAGSP
ncbi:MAG: peptidoglycan DD-metalloendopeptidase family protein, partial [Paracoccaceae bacterium]